MYEMTLTNVPHRYSFAAIPEYIKKELATVKLDVNNYIEQIKKHKPNRLPNQYYYDYDLELDFSIDPDKPENIKLKIYDDRLYYYKAYHYLKLGLFQKPDAPPFKVRLSHLSRSLVYELSELTEKDRKFVLKQAISRIFEDVNFALYHDSISGNLGVILVN